MKISNTSFKMTPYFTNPTLFSEKSEGLFFQKFWKLNSPTLLRRGGSSNYVIPLSVAFDHALFEYSLIGSYNYLLWNLFLGKFILIWLCYTCLVLVCTCTCTLNFLLMSNVLSFFFFLKICLDHKWIYLNLLLSFLSRQNFFLIYKNFTWLYLLIGNMCYLLA